MLAGLGRWVAMHPVRVIVVWVVVVVTGAGAALGVFGQQGLFDRLSGSTSDVPGQAREVDDLITAHTPPTRQVLLQVDQIDVTSPAVQQHLASAISSLGTVAGVRIAAPLDRAGPAAAALTSADGRSALVTATVSGTSGEASSDAAAARARAALTTVGARVEADVPGARARVGSVDDLTTEINRQVEADLRTGEAAALPLSLLVMVVVFGGFLAAGIPVLGALATIACGLAALLGYSYLTALDSSVVNVVTILGLGLCIDDGLLVVSRYREELRVLDAAGQSTTERETRTLALERTVASAGRTVAFSAVTVAISLAGLLVFGAAVLRSMGLASVSVVVVAMLVALTLVPALLSLGGARLARPGATARIPLLRRITRWLGVVRPAQGFFSALAMRVQKAPWAVLGAVVVVLALAASPVASMRLRADGVALLPVGDSSRAFFTDLDAHFPAASSPAVTVVAKASSAQVAAYASRVSAMPGVASVDPPEPLGPPQRGAGSRSLESFGVRVTGDPQGPRALALVTALRIDRPAFDTWVGGNAAAVIDFRSDLVSRAPWAIALVVVATFALLFLLTGSVLVPAKALVVNVMSLGACLGVVVWVFQWGHLQGPLGFTSTGGIETFVPPLALAFGFGLAMDYEVFLLSRIIEAHRSGLRTDAAVVVGLQRSGRIITSAALIIVIVFAGFVTGHLLVIKQVGLALAVAVAVDASLVRMLLVPAVMTILGERNWWAPPALRRVHERFGIDEHRVPADPGALAPRPRRTVGR